MFASKNGWSKWLARREFDRSSPRSGRTLSVDRPLFWALRPAQRKCVRTGLRSHSRCHPYRIPQRVMVGHTTGVYDFYSFRIVMWVILRPTRTNQGKCCEKGTYGFSSLSEKTRKSKHLQMSLQRQHFLLSYLKTLSVGPAGVRARDLPLSSPALSQLSQTGGSFVLSNLPRASKTRWMHAARLSFLK